MFVDGKTPSAIAKQLASQGIPSPAGKRTWQVATITSILGNEKYKGDALLQKKLTVDFLTKKQKPNEGEVPQYYVQNSHPAIIEPDEFDAVQAEIERARVLVGRLAVAARFRRRLSAVIVAVITVQRFASFIFFQKRVLI